MLSFLTLLRLCFGQLLSLLVVIYLLNPFTNILQSQLPRNPYLPFLDTLRV